MSDVKHFRAADLDFSGADAPPHVAAQPVVNMAISNSMGGGTVRFQAGCDVEWTIDCDEIVFAHEGAFRLGVGDAVFDVVPGDTLWIPAGTTIRYQADEDGAFFYTTSPIDRSPSTSRPQMYPATPPRKA